MSNEKFTHGKWQVERVDIDEGGCLHFTVMCLPGDNGGIRIDGETIQSTTALIAAAPEMYRMLKHLADGVRWGGIQHTDRSLAAEIENLLKKAMGGNE